MLCWSTASGIAVLRILPSRAPVGHTEVSSCRSVRRGGLIDRGGSSRRRLRESPWLLRSRGPEQKTLRREFTSACRTEGRNVCKRLMARWMAMGDREGIGRLRCRTGPARYAGALDRTVRQCWAIWRRPFGRFARKDSHHKSGLSRSSARTKDAHRFHGEQFSTNCLPRGIDSTVRTLSRGKSWAVPAASGTYNNYVRACRSVPDALPPPSLR
jgi:hypothetical protein